MAMKCDACGVDVYEWDGKPACECYPYGIDAPKPATPEPPELPPLGEQFMLDGRPYVVTGVVQSEPGTPEEIIDRVTDALSDFTARRKAKREALPATGHDWPHDSGLLFSKRLCRKCGLNGADIRSATVCDGPRAAKPSPSVARAMSTPLPHDPPMSARLMPWRGK